MKITYLLNTRFTSILFILLTIVQLSACNADESPVATTPPIVDLNATAITNHPAIITGVDSGSVTEDKDVGADNLLKAGGTLVITEIDADEDAFVEISIDGAYGSLSISADGVWSYSADNNQAAIQSLASGTFLSDSLTISSIDGTQHTVVVIINGADEVSTPININLTWNIPSEREDNTPLSLSAIGGYNIYYGSKQGQYINTVSIEDGSAESYTFTDLPTGTYYFVVTTYDTDGRESMYSTEIIKTI
ncbi:MAG: VCBS domain-containing protein [Gammaproteobacteria bacterium]|nr:VCBS domain-containing protein [Gammaproteobacteria bacterium]